MGNNSEIDNEKEFEVQSEDSDSYMERVQFGFNDQFDDDFDEDNEEDSLFSDMYISREIYIVSK